MPVRIAAEIGGETPAESVLLHYAASRGATFKMVEMKADPKAGGEKETLRRFSAVIPGMAAGTEVYYYVEARAGKAVGTAAFKPARTEVGALHYRVPSQSKEK